MKPVTVGLDIGTSAVKAIAADETGRVVASHRQPHQLLTPTPDHFEHDALQAWHHGCQAAWRQVAAGQDVQAVCVAGFVPSLAGMDEDNRPCTPGLLYGDIRGSAAENLSKPPIENLEFQGFVSWMAQAHPQARSFGPVQAVANAALCGESVLDTATAFTAMPVFNGAGWDSDLCAELGISAEQLPRLVDSHAPAGELTAQLTDICRRPENPVVLAGGTIDALAEQYAVDAGQPGDVLVMLGATLVTWVVLEGWVEIENLWTVPHHEPGLCLVGGPSNAGGIFINHLHQLLGQNELPAEAELKPRDIPVWLPYIRGERTPLHTHSIRASLHGLNLTHGCDELLRAGYEASGFVIKHHLDLAFAGAQSDQSDQPSQPNKIVLTGGGAHNLSWVQAIADANGLNVETPAVLEGAAFGAAFLARVATGLEDKFEDISRWRQSGHSFQPNRDWNEACQLRYETFAQLTENSKTAG